MTRALYSAYNGKLFQARRASDGKTQDIGVTAAGGSVDMATLNTFCSETTCSVSLLYDQSGNANDLPQATPANQPPLPIGPRPMAQNCPWRSLSASNG